MSRDYTDSEWENYFKHGRRLWKPRGGPREGLNVPPELWQCSGCGRRYRGFVRLDPHMERSRHGSASAVRKSIQK